MVVAFPTLMLVYCLVSALGHLDYGSRATVMALWRCAFAHLVSLFLKSSRSHLSLMTFLCSSRYKIPSSCISVLCRFGARRRRADCLSRLSLRLLFLVVPQLGGNGQSVRPPQTFLYRISASTPLHWPLNNSTNHHRAPHRHTPLGVLLAMSGCRHRSLDANRHRRLDSTL